MSSLVRLGLLVEGGLILLAWGLTLAFNLRLSWDGLALGTTLAAGSLAAIPMFGAFLLSWRGQIRPLREIRQTLTEVLGARLRHTSVWGLALISLLAGVGEEWLFRGVIQGGLTGWLGLHWAMALGAISFGLAHSLSLTYALAATLMGWWLAMLGYWTGGLLAPILAHALYDFLALLYVRRELAHPR